MSIVHMSMKQQHNDTQDNRPRVRLYTDGACSGNPGPGGWAYILEHPASGHSRSDSGGERLTTNNRMELMAVIRGLEALRKASVVELYSDSDYVVAGINERMACHRAAGWRRSFNSPKKIRNADLWRRLAEAADPHELTATLLKGHAGHPQNERCDTMAVEAAQQAADLPLPEASAADDTSTLFE